MDKIPSGKVLRQIGSIAERIEGVEKINDIKARFKGTFLHIDLYINVDENLSMKEADQIAKNVEQRLIDKITAAKEVNAILS